MRHQRLLDLVTRLRAEQPPRAVSVEKLGADLGVSTATIRRDLHRLEADGRVVRVHGGALLADPGQGHLEDADRRHPFAEVARVDLADKQAVAREAAGLISDGDTVLLDIGTTTQIVARELVGRPVTVVTASLAVVDVLRDDERVELIVLGGMVRRAYHSLTGVLTEDNLRQLRADVAVIGASGVRADGAVVDTTLVEVPVKRGLLTAARRSILVADQHKFPGTGTLRICLVGDLDIMVTNVGADPETLALAVAAGVEVRSV